MSILLLLDLAMPLLLPTPAGQVLKLALFLVTWTYTRRQAG